MREAELGTLERGQAFRLQGREMRLHRVEGGVAHVLQDGAVVPMARTVRVMVEEPGEAQPAPPKPLAEGELRAAFEQALREKPPRPRRLSPQEELVALQRKWKLVYPNNGVPEGLEALRALIPSGLRPLEVRGWLLGSLEEARAVFLRTLNTSWTRRDLQRRLQEMGVEKALSAFPPRTRRGLEGAIRALTD